jgi:hypothetical protein
MLDADYDCTKANDKIALYETQKVKNITNSCAILTPDELCGAQADGLGFATLNAGCQALDPNYTCNLTNLINCVGGPLERQHLDQISMLLHPRASEAVAAAGLQSYFPTFRSRGAFARTCPKARPTSGRSRARQATSSWCA